MRPRQDSVTGISQDTIFIWDDEICDFVEIYFWMDGPDYWHLNEDIFVPRGLAQPQPQPPPPPPPQSQPIASSSSAPFNSRAYDEYDDHDSDCSAVWGSVSNDMSEIDSVDSVDTSDSSDTDDSSDDPSDGDSHNHVIHDRGIRDTGYHVTRDRGIRDTGYRLMSYMELHMDHYLRKTKRALGIDPSSSSSSSSSSYDSDSSDSDSNSEDAGNEDLLDDNRETFSEENCTSRTGRFVGPFFAK